MEVRDKKGKFGKGNSGKPKGAINKTLTRTRIGGLIEDNWDRFLKELNSLKGKAFVEAFSKLLPFHMPVYSAINFSLKNMSEDELAYLLEKLKTEFKNEQEIGID